MRSHDETASLDGVTVLRTDSPHGRNLAALSFRVGRLDETLATAGVTHLVEHLALADTHDATYKFNAEVSGRFTSFFVESADPRDISDFFGTVCAGLTADREAGLEKEKRILRTEAASRGGSGALGACLSMRYGARGPGLLGYDEIGLHRLSWPEIEAWRRRWFVTGNAVLWIAGTIPGELRLELLPGPPPPSDLPRPLPLDLPGYFTYGRGGVGISAVGPRDLAGAATADVLQQRLTKVLRHEHGLSYRVQATRDELHTDLAHSWLAADALPDQISVTAHTMLGALEQLASDGCTPEEIQDYTRRLREMYQSPAGPATMLHRRACDLLEQRPAREPEEVLDQVAALAPREVGDACGELLAQAIVVTPGLVPAVDGRMRRLPAWSAETVTGPCIDSRHPGRSLTVGTAGMTLAMGRGKQVTVKFDAVAAMLRWTDGKRTLVGDDGFVLQLDPAEWSTGDELASMLDAKVDPLRTADMDAAGPPGQAAEPPSSGRLAGRRAAVLRELLPRILPGFCVAGLLVYLNGSDAGLAIAAVALLGTIGSWIVVYRNRRRTTSGRSR